MSKSNKKFLKKCSFLAHLDPFLCKKWRFWPKNRIFFNFLVFTTTKFVPLRPLFFADEDRKQTSYLKPLKEFHQPVMYL